MKRNVPPENPWPFLIGLIAFIAAMAISTQPHTPRWLAHAASVTMGFVWIYFLFRDARKTAATADELELRIRFEGHALALRLTLAALIVALQFERTMDLQLQSFHFALILLGATLIGTWWVRRRYS